jgi:hypothetical protein
MHAIPCEVPVLSTIPRYQQWIVARIMHLSSVNNFSSLRHDPLISQRYNTRELNRITFDLSHDAF